MTSSLEKLISELEKQQPYQPLGEEEIRRQAAQRYQSQYDQKRLSAQQAYESSDAALARELSGLQKSYDAQRLSSEAVTRGAYSQADRHALSRGMQRSSYNEETLANIGLAGDQALREIDRAQAEHEAGIGEKRTELSRQLSQTLKQLTADQQNDESAYADELAAREYERSAAGSAAYRELALRIYEYQHELEQEAAEQARWQAEFAAKYGGGSGGGRKRAGASDGEKTSSAAPKTSGVRKNQKETMT